MKVCATTDRHESTILAFPRSNTKLVFLIRFTQNLKGKKLVESFFLELYYVPERKRI